MKSKLPDKRGRKTRLKPRRSSVPADMSVMECLDKLLWQDMPNGESPKMIVLGERKS